MKKKVLFLCTGNSARSQMAEGLLRHLAGERCTPYSAGVAPVPVNPRAVKVMLEIGIDISRQKSKSVDEFKNRTFDYVVTVCDNAKGSCPVFPGEFRKLHWNLEDPAQAQGIEEEKLNVFRKIRNQLKEHIIGFLNLPRDKANLKCPLCGDIQEVLIPQNSCLHFYECTACRKNIVPTPESCCVICAYADKNCPK